MSRYVSVCSVSAHRVDLSQHRTLSEEQRLPGVHQDQIKVGLPGPVGGTSLWWVHTHTHTVRVNIEHASFTCTCNTFKVRSKGRESFVLPSGHEGSQTGRSWFSEGKHTQWQSNQMQQCSELRWPLALLKDWQTFWETELKINSWPSVWSLQFLNALTTVFPKEVKLLPKLHAYTHISVFVVTVGSQENLGN